MKVRLKSSGEVCWSSNFNTSTVGEIIVSGGQDIDTWWHDTCFISDFDVLLEATQQWKDMRQAFKDHDLITDNYNTCFFEPANPAERQQGWRE